MTTETTESPASIPDLSGTLFQETAELQMLVPGTGNLAGWTITLAGPSHPKAVAYRDDQARRDIHKAGLVEQARVNGRKYKAQDETPAEQRQKFIEGIVARIATWTPIAIGGKTYTFTDANAVELLSKPEMGGYLSQIVDYLVSETAFTPNSASK
jgi:hypothetical protein